MREPCALEQGLRSVGSLRQHYWLGHCWDDTVNETVNSYVRRATVVFPIWYMVP